MFLSREAVAVSKPSCPVVDVGVVRYTTNEILPQKVQAKPEETEVAQKLIPSLSDAEIEEVRMYGVFLFRSYQLIVAPQNLMCLKQSFASRVNKSPRGSY